MVEIINETEDIICVYTIFDYLDATLELEDSSDEARYKREGTVVLFLLLHGLLTSQLCINYLAKYQLDRHIRHLSHNMPAIQGYLGVCIRQRRWSIPSKARSTPGFRMSARSNFRASALSHVSRYFDHLQPRKTLCSPLDRPKLYIRPILQTRKRPKRLKLPL
jgi:hypothetical protein